jgi:dihydrolipoamide dehydrogenase
MEKLTFDVCVIGSGPAGFAAAMRSYDFEKHVCIIEGGHIGGAGIVNGALSSKTMWELSKDFSVASKTDRGYQASGLKPNYHEVIRAVKQAAGEKQYQILSQIETFSRKPDCDKSLTLIRGWAKFKDKNTLIINKRDGSQVEITADDFIVATGSTPREHPTIKTDGERIIHSDHMDKLKAFPKRIMIVGAGIVGCEFATIFANFGQTKVHLLDSQQKVIPFEDEDVSDYVNEKLEEIGVIMHHKASLREVRRENNHIDVILDHEDGHVVVVPVDVVLISIGRIPLTKDIGLEEIGATITERGLLQVDSECRVMDHIYAAGDISGNMALVNIAEMEGRFAAKAINQRIKHPLSYDNISTIMFFSPEISAIGLNEKACQKQEISYKVIHYSHALISRAIAMRSTSGFFKIIVSNEDDPVVLGMRAAGPQSAAALIFVAPMIYNKQRLSEIMRTVHPHPSISEGIQECLRAFSNKNIFKWKAFPDKIKFWTWAPEA